MKKVRVLSINSRIPNLFTYPIRKNRRTLYNGGYDIKIFYKADDKHFHCDILCLVSKYFRNWWSEPDRVFEFISKVKRYCNKIVWLDDSDSTGVTHFELLAYIDLYLKKQLLKDKRLYAEQWYGDRVFTDFYHREFGIKDESVYQSKPLNLALSHKVQLSWHIGIGDMIGDILPRPIKVIKSFLPPTYPTSLIPAKKTRHLDVMARGTRKYSRKTVSFQRESIGEILDGMKHLRSALAGRVSISEYKKEMRNAKVAVSPFGWGEIGVRDFEAWIYGAALIKPDMSHMETWPDIFKAGITYEPISWGLEDLEHRIEQLLADDKRRVELAERGQSEYRKMISPEGMERFCNWFIQQINK